MKITIKDKEIELKYSIRALMMFENVADKSFGFNTLSDMIVLFYCVILTSAKDYTLDYNDFLDWIDEDSSVLQDFSKWVTTVTANQSKLKKN